MSYPKKYLFFLIPGLLLALVVAKALRPGSAPLEPAPPYSFSDGRLILAPNSQFLSGLEIVGVGKTADESREFRAVGQIIALSNTSSELMGDGIGWVELEPRLTASVNLKLGAGEPAGVAYGLANLPGEYGPRLAVGQNVRIARYGLKKSGVSASIAKIVPVPGDGINIVFRFAQAQDWFPGTNCEVDFPLLRGHPVRIPTTAPVHEGAQEYVWKEVGPGQFVAQSISMVDSSPADVSVLGLAPGDRVVGRGAILLKPLLKPLLTQKRG